VIRIYIVSPSDMRYARPDAKHGAEDLLPPDEGAESRVDDHRRRDVVALIIMTNNT
jgi:hypothetical protein